MDGAVVIPVIQTDNSDITQLQQNVNKVLLKFSQSIVQSEDDINAMTIVGEVKIANLSEDEFQTIAGENWLINNGQSCVNTTYSKLTGNNTVTTLTVGGFNTFTRVD